MALTLKQFSPLYKVKKHDPLDMPSLSEQTALRGERVSYQIAVQCTDYRLHARVWVESPIAEAVKLYCEKDVVVDMPSTVDVTDDHYLMTEPGLLPDVLIPLDDQNGRVFTTPDGALLWVRVDIPHDLTPGDYPVTVHFGIEGNGFVTAPFLQTDAVTFTVHVTEKELPDQELPYTRWIYLDCIADAHEVDIFSEAHWALIEKYIAAAADVGINMLLVPVHTPPLDTGKGLYRPCVQLVDIEKVGETYRFGFERFHRYIEICKRNGIRYFEIAHMFSQWGAQFAPNIMVTENGKTDYLFGWQTPATDAGYGAFLKQYIAAISAELQKEGIADRTYFHISDEPTDKNMEQYRSAREIFRPLVGESKIFDALSHIEFYHEGLVTTPVTVIDSIHKFLAYDIPDQWLYYCCLPERVYPNSFIAMSLSRLRVIGILMYKYDIKGFLHWGLNFYNAARSKFKVNPYLTTSADGAFPSGDAYILYPAKNGAYGCLRGEVMYDALQDMRVARALEEKLGREAVISLIDEMAERDLRFDDYPDDPAYLAGLRAEMVCRLSE